MQNAIRTTASWKEIFNRKVLIHYRGSDVKATLEITEEEYDPKTKIYTRQIGLILPKKPGKISLQPSRKSEGRTRTKQPVDYWLTQKDFDAIMRNEKIAPKLINAVSVEIGENKGELEIFVNTEHSQQLCEFLKAKSVSFTGPHHYRSNVWTIDKDGRKQFSEIPYMDIIYAKGTMEQCNQWMDKWLDTIP